MERNYVANQDYMMVPAGGNADETGGLVASMQRTGLSLSARSDKNSLPDITNRSVTEGVAETNFEGSGSRFYP